MTPGKKVRAKVFGSLRTVAEAHRAIESGLPTSSLISQIADFDSPRPGRSRTFRISHMATYV